MFLLLCYKIGSEMGMSELKANKEPIWEQAELCICMIHLTYENL